MTRNTFRKEIYNLLRSNSTYLCPKLSINGVNGGKIQLKKLFLTKIERKKASDLSLITTYVHLYVYAHKCFIILLTSNLYMVQNTLSSYLPPGRGTLFSGANFIGGGTEKRLPAGLEQAMRYNLTSYYFSGIPLCGEAMRHEW